MHEKRYHREVSSLRDPERIARLEVARVVELALAGMPIQSMLDVGTGSGLFAEQFNSLGIHVGGVDANPAMIAAARVCLPQADLREAVAETLPFEPGSFDLVFLGLVLHETDDPLEALNEARRVALRRVAILEWPYIEAEIGPPLAHRLSTSQVIEIAGTAGMDPPEVIPLQNLLLYRFDLPDESEASG
jgi:ubiquinone/menaquinone biosynthesis C-methylase UbiE